MTTQYNLLGHHRQFNYEPIKKLVHINGGAEFYMVLGIGDNLTKSPLVTKLNDDPGIFKRILIWFLKKFLPYTQKSSSSVAKFGTLIMIEVFSGYLSLTSLSCDCVHGAPAMTTILSLFSNSFVSPVRSCNKTSVSWCFTIVR